MICLSPTMFVLFMTISGLGYDIAGPVITVHAERPLAYVWRGEMMCVGGAAT